MKKPINLVPHSGVQFMVLGFDIDAGPRRARSFIERRQPGHPSVDGLVPVRLLPGFDEADPEAEPPHRPQAGDDDYDISNAKALDPFVERWVPMPFFAVLPGRTADGYPLLDKGPSNWARARLMRCDKASTGFTHHLVLAFDTQLAEGPRGASYDAPRRDDAANERHFALAWRFDDLGWFFSDEHTDVESQTVSDFQEWLSRWLETVFHDHKRRERPGRAFRPEDLEHRLEHIARYIAFLHIVQALLRPGPVKLLDTVSDDPFAKPVEVDLVLDIGNSRTCGILIESFANEDQVDLGNSMVLQLRDLSRPDTTYVEPFDSHVELAQAQFGPEALSRRSGRARAFLWPSLVRVGTEAARFREMAEGTERSSGMSSPKRYLWDTAPVPQPWSFQPSDYADPNTPPLIQRSVSRFVSPRGDVLAEVARDRAFYASLAGKGVSLDDMLSQMTFSRSSFFTFLVGEVIVQALSMINNVQVREKRAFADAPRRLNRLILTMPTAMPVREQRIMQSRVQGAVSLIWELMGWNGQRSTILRPPELIVRWDEASCVQFVYLYTEIARKSGGDAETFFKLVGRPRAFAEGGLPPADPTPRPSLRVASVDIGGGTTDLMITTYYADGRFAIVPSQTFRESFRIAGDDVLRAVIERIVVPALERHLSSSGVREPRDMLNSRFGGNRANMSEQDKHLRQQFVLRVLRPLGLDLLRACEAGETEEGTGQRTVAELVAIGRMHAVSPHIEGYVAIEAARLGAPGFRLADFSVPYEVGRVRDAVAAVLDDVFDNIAEVLDHFDCDVVLLAGRPSRLPAVVDLMVNKLAVAPDRILPLHEYRVGSWYPFKTRDNVRISDPKTATVVGGMLCALAQRQIVNLTIDTDRLTLRSTAAFIGTIENNGKILADNVLFTPEQGPEASDEAALAYYAPLRLGTRQLPFERWTATPLYKLSLGAGPRRPRLPIKAVLRRGLPEGDAGFEDVDRLLADEARKEEIELVEAYDGDDRTFKPLMALSLDTMAADEGYWLDTGILTIN